jgi:hypothetical protein
MLPGSDYTSFDIYLYQFFFSAAGQSNDSPLASGKLVTVGWIGF